MREVRADAGYLHGLDLLVEKPGRHQLHSDSDEESRDRRRDILRPWMWCAETAVQSPWHPAQMHELNLTGSSIAQTQTAEWSRTIAQCSSVSRSHQAREDREVSRLGETEASHLATKSSAWSWLSWGRSCCWPYPMSALGRMGGGNTGTVCVIFATRLFQN